ncbi:hypothetical protein ACQFX9_21045 [Aliinostoc sp. HNIBRCY26]|uniref:hypothetical protein n=1 Tax=Aliinostoc sp. HNIBRCY26 TaxID=3418997 RepID=UPI003D0946E6
MNVTLKSAGVAAILLWLLRIATALTLVSTILKLIDYTTPTFPLQNLWNLFFIISFCISLAISILSLVWIYRLHEDLHQCYEDYPISSWNALWSFIFIIFIWKTLMTIANHFQAESLHLQRYGLHLYSLVPVMYGIFITYYLLRQVIYQYDYTGRVVAFNNIPGFLLLIFIVGKEILAIGGVIVMLTITQTIVDAMQLKVRQINHRI